MTAPEDEPRSWRVKLYSLDGLSTWEELGTGQLHISGREVSVSDERSDTSLLKYSIGTEIYHRQGRTILSWATPEIRTYALSFQESEGAESVLMHFCALQSRSVKDVPIDDFSSEEEDTVPDINLDSLALLGEHLYNMRIMGKSAISEAIVNTTFLDELGQLFRHEESEQSKYLPLFFEVYKELVHCGSEPLLHSLLSDAHYEELFGGLECNLNIDAPDLKGKDLHFRSFLKSATLRNVLETTDSAFLELVKRSFRLQYLKDIALARCVDEGCAGFLLNSQVNSWNDVIEHFLKESELKTRLFSQLKTFQFPAYELLNDLSGMGKSASPYLRMELYEFLYSEGILELIGEAFSTVFPPSETNKIRVFLSDLLISLLTILPSRIQEFFSSEDLSASKGLLLLLTSAMIHSNEISPIQELGELLRLILEPCPERRLNEVFDGFYASAVPELMLELTSEHVKDEEHRIRICEILHIFTICVQSHGYRVRFFMSNSEILKTCLTLLKTKDGPVTLSVLKFIKATILKNDQFLVKLIVNEKVLEEVWSRFVDNGEKENMLFSASLALIQTIEKIDNGLLDEHIHETRHLFDKSPLRLHFQDILDRYESTEKPLAPPATLCLPREIALKQDAGNFPRVREEKDTLKRRRDSESAAFEKKVKLESGLP